MNKPAVSPDSEHPQRHQQLSELMDGALDREAASDLLAAWRDDASLQWRWHAYQLVGDVMRSDDLAQGPAHDDAFLAALRERLKDEPVPLAPRPLAADRPASFVAAGRSDNAEARRRWRRWTAPVAMAAGVAAVAGVVVVMRTTQPDAGAAQLASAAAASRPASVAGVMVVRNARLDQYLHAHRSQDIRFDRAAGEPVMQVQLLDGERP